jgi:nicotinamide-nucleotide amidase
MMPMFEREVLEPLAASAISPVTTQLLHTLGRGESDIAGVLDELMDRDRDPLVGTTASQGVVTVRIRSEAPRDEAIAAVRETTAEIRTRLGDCIFSDGLDLAPYVLERLGQVNATIGTVESCTGGLVAGALTDIPGSSVVFMGGLVTYSNAMKSALANVPAELIRKYGAVSPECAVAMAEGGRQRLGTTHCLAITGIAGPGGGNDTKPVGTVWIALATEHAPTDVRQFLFRGGRDAIRSWSITSALGLLRLRLDGVKMSLLGQRPEAF